jgi:HEAT repeat protein
MRRLRGFTLPSFGQTVLLATALGVGWLLWTDTGTRHLILGLPMPGEPPTAELQTFEALVNEGREAVPKLRGMIVDPDPKIRRYAALALGRIGMVTGDTLELVRSRLDDSDASVRSYAFVAFSMLCQNQDDLQAVAARLLVDPDDDLQHRAHRFLAELGRDAVPKVVALLKSENPDARRHAVGILVWIHRNREPLGIADEVRPLLNDPDGEIRASAIQAVVEWEAAEPDEALVWLRDENLRVVDSGLRAIDWDHPVAASAIPDLCRLLETTHGDRRRTVLGALRAQKTAARSAIRLILPLAAAPGEIGESHERFGPTREELIETLAEIGAGGDDMSRLLTPHLMDAHYGRWACGLLSRTSPDDARLYVSRVLLPQLARDRSSVDPQVLAALAGIGPQAQQAVPALIPLIDDPDCSVALAAIETLAAIGPDGAAGAVPYLVRHIEHLDPAVPLTALIETLGGVGPAARAAVPGLVALLESSHALAPATEGREIEVDWFRHRLILALGRVGNQDPRALAALDALLKSESWQDRGAAAEALAFRGTATPELLAELVDRLGDREAYVRASAALAIGGLAGDRAAAVEPLSQALTDTNAFVQTAAAIALEECGAPAAPAASALRDVLRDPKNSHPSYRRVKSSWPWDLTPVRLSARRSVAHAARVALAQIERDVK